MTSIAGFQILRLLGRGSHADVLLGHATVPRAEPLLAAIKRFHPNQHRAALREAHTLARLDHPHVHTVLDLATAPSGESVLILPRLDSGGLAAWMAARGAVSAGEVVTATAPLVSAIEHLHARGVAHTRIAAHKVLFDEAGAPILCGFSDSLSTVYSADATKSSDAAVARDLSPTILSDDWSAWWAIVDELSGRVANPSPALIDLVRWGSEKPWRHDPDVFAAEALDRIFVVAEPVPLQEHSPGGAAMNARVAAPTAVSIIARQDRTPLAEAASTRRARRHPRRGMGRLSAWAGHLPQRWASAVERCRDSLAGVRRAYWIVGAAGVVCVGAIVGLDVAADPEGSDSAQLSAGIAPQVGDGADNPADTTSGGGPSGETLPGEAVPVDPVEAARVLLHATSDGAPSVDIDSLVLADEMGDTALLTGVMVPEPGIAHTTPASVLMIRTEAGWRVRRLIAAD